MFGKRDMQLALLCSTATVVQHTVRNEDKEDIVMCFFFSLIPATMFTVIGYFVLFSSTKAEGRVKSFGQILAIWIFIIATFPIMMSIYVTLSGLCPLEDMFNLMTTMAKPQ